MQSESNSKNYIRPSQVERDFYNNAIPGYLEWVPGISLENKFLLEQNGISKTDHLVGNFFFLERDEQAFIDFLIELKIEKSDAVMCARSFARKFGSL
jgi:hypothetical protein